MHESPATAGLSSALGATTSFPFSPRSPDNDATVQLHPVYHSDDCKLKALVDARTFDNLMQCSTQVLALRSVVDSEFPRQPSHKGPTRTVQSMRQNQNFINSSANINITNPNMVMNSGFRRGTGKTVEPPPSFSAFTSRAHEQTPRRGGTAATANMYSQQVSLADFAGQPQSSLPPFVVTNTPQVSSELPQAQ